MSNNIPVSSNNYFSSFEDENNKIIDAALDFAHTANEGYTRTRTATDGMIMEVALRALAELDNQPFSVRKHLTLADVSHFMSLIQKNKAITASVKNTDILPIAHPRSTQMHMLSIEDYIAATARWIADDPSIKNDETRAMVASMLSAPEGSAEREYYQTRLENLPQGEVPIRALVAAFKLGANKGFWRFQRRDRKGKFAFMGGGISALVRGSDGVVRKLTGRTVSAGGSDQTGDSTFDMEISPGRLARVPATSSESSKAYLASPDAVDGMSPVKARVQSGDEVLDISEVQYPDAPSGFSKTENSGQGSPEEKEYYGEDADFGETFSDGNYTIRKFDSGNSPIAKDNFELAQEAEKSCGLVAAAGDNNCPISVNGGGPDNSLDPDKPVLFTSRSDDPNNPDVFSVTQNWSDAMTSTRQDEKLYSKGQAPSPNKGTAVADANSPEGWDGTSIEEAGYGKYVPFEEPITPRIIQPEEVTPGRAPLELRVPLPGPINPRIPIRPRPSGGRAPSPGGRAPGTGRRWGSAGPNEGHAPYPIPGRRVYPGEIADMRIGSEMEQSIGGLFSVLFGTAKKRQLRKVGSDEWVDLETGETYTNNEVSEMAATKGTDRTPFTGLATGPEVRAGTFTNKMSGSLFKELPIGTELNDHLRVFNVMTQFRKIGENQWRRWDGKIFTDDEVQAKSGTMQIDRVGEFGPGASSNQEKSEETSKSKLPRGPLTPKELAELAAGAVVSVAGEGEDPPRFFEKIGENEWREIDPENSMPDPLVPFTNEDIVNIGRDITLEKEPEEAEQAQLGMRPSDLTPEALENLPAGTIVGFSDEAIDNLNLPRRPYADEEAYQEALEEAKAFFRMNRWRKRGPNEWVNDFNDFATDDDILKTQGLILSLGDEFSVPEGYYDLNKEQLYTPVGAAEGQTSPDFTDDPSELAQTYSEEELKSALKEALENPNGFGSLEFEYGDEPVPAEALYHALVRKLGVNGADKFVNDVYGDGRQFNAEQELAREFPDILSTDPEKRKIALIQAWNSQWGRSKFALDKDGNFTVVGKDNDSIATQYLLDKINAEEWGPEFLADFGNEYRDVLNDRTKAEIKALYDAYPGLLSEDPEERRANVLLALGAVIRDDEFITDENGNIIEVVPKSALTKLLWDMAQPYIGGTSSPTGSKDAGPLPAVIEGASDEEKAEFAKTGDYRPFLPKDNPESFENVWNNYYNPLPEPYNPEDGLPEINPLNLARRFTPDQLKEQLREAILDGSGYGVVSFDSPSGEPVEFRVPAEALRDALQLQGEDANSFIQNIFNENLSPAKQVQKLLDEIVDLKTKRDAEKNRTEKGKLTRETNKKSAEVGMRYKAIEALKNREAQLDKLSKQTRLSDEQRQQVLDKLEQVRARREQEENIFNGDLERGQSMTPFEDNVADELEKFDFEGRPTQKPAETETSKAREFLYKRVGDKVFVRSGKGAVTRNNPELEQFLEENGFVYDRNVNIQFHIAEMSDEEFYEFMRTARDRFNLELKPAPGQDIIDFDSPTGGAPSTPNPSNTKKRTKETLLEDIKNLKPVDQEGNEDNSKRAVGTYLARIIATLDEYLEGLDEESPLRSLIEGWRRKYNNRAGRHGKEKEVGTSGQDNRIVNVRPRDYRPGDVFVSDHFTITKVEKSDVPYKEGDPYFGEQRITYTGYYPGGREETRSQVGRSEYYRTEAVYRGVTAPQKGENDPIPPAPNAVAYLPEGVPESETGPDGVVRSNIKQIKDKDLAEIMDGQTFYMPDPQKFPSEHAQFMKDFEEWRQKVISRKNLWSPDAPSSTTPATTPAPTPTTPTTPTSTAGAKAVRKVESAKAKDLLPGDITVRRNDDGSMEIFVIEEIVEQKSPAPVATGTAPSGKEQDFYNEVAELEPNLVSEDSNLSDKKSAYIRLEEKYRTEARDAGQLTGGIRTPQGEGELFDKWKWLTSQREGILENKPIQTPEEAALEPLPVTPSGPLKVIIRGYHPGHQRQDRSWNPNTPIEYIRGEDKLPPAGDKDPVMSTSEIRESNASEEEKAQMRKDREAVLAESSKDYMASVMIENPPEATSRAAQEPKGFLIIQTKLAAFWKSAADLARGKTGKEIKEALKNERVAFFDFETSGRGFDRDVPSAPVQVGAVVYENGEEVARKVFYINPGEKLGAFYYEKQEIRKNNNEETDNFPEGGKVAHFINDQVTVYTKTDGKYVNDADPSDVLDNIEALRGRSTDILQVNEEGNIFLQSSGLKDPDGNPISDEFLSSVQTGVEDAIRELVDFIGPNAYLVAYNADFDVNYLQTFADHFKVNFNYGGVIDPLPMARELNPGGASARSGNRLEQVAARYGIIREPGEWHNAEIDVEVLPEILDRLLDDLSPSSPLLDVDRRIAEYTEAVRKYNEQLALWRSQNNIPTPQWGVSPEKKVTGEDPTAPAESLEDLESTLIGANADSILGGQINDDWVKDGENTYAISSGSTNVENLLTGDLFVDKNGQYNEIINVQNDRLTKQKIVTFRNISTGEIEEASSSLGSRLQVGTAESPVRRRKEFEGLSQAEILDLIVKNQRRNILEMAVPRTRVRDVGDAAVAQAFDNFINNRSSAPSVAESMADPEVSPEEMEEFLEGEPEGRQTTEYHFDKNGRAVAKKDRAIQVITRINPETKKREVVEVRTGEIVELVPEQKQSSSRGGVASIKTYRNYVRFKPDGEGKYSYRVAADSLELVNPPVKEEALSPLADIALTPEDEPKISRMALMRKIERLLPYITNDPNYKPQVGNNVKAAVRAYQRGDYATADKLIKNAEAYVDYLETPSFSLEEVARLVNDRLRGLQAAVQDPEADPKIRQLYSQAVLLSNVEARSEMMRRFRAQAEPLFAEIFDLEELLEQESDPAEQTRLNNQIEKATAEIQKLRNQASKSRINYGQALRKIDQLEDLLWSGGEKNRSKTKSSPLEVRKFLNGEEILSAIDAPLSKEYFAQLLKDASAPDYDFPDKEDIVRQAKQAANRGEIFPAAQVLERLAREREKQLDRAYPNSEIKGPDGSLIKRKDAGKLSYTTRSISEINYKDKDPAKFKKSTLEKAKDETDSISIKQVEKAGRRGLFYTSAKSLAPKDIVSISNLTAASVEKIRQNADGSLDIVVTSTISKPILDEDGNEIGYGVSRWKAVTVNPDDEIMLLYRGGKSGSPLPPMVREVGAARPREGADYNEFEGFVDEGADSEGSTEPQERENKLFLAVPQSSKKEALTPTPEQAAILDALDDPSIKKIKIVAKAGTGKTTTLKMAAEKLLKQDPNAKITVVMFNVELSEDTKRKMPKKGVEVIRSGQLAARYLDKSLQEKRKSSKNKKLTGQEIAKELGIQGPTKLKINGEEKEFSPTDLVSVIVKAEKAYANSADDTIGPKHFNEQFDEIPEEVVAFTQQYFDKATDPNGKIQLEHHHTVKLFSLLSPDLAERDKAQNQYLFYDEAQDVNPAVEKVISAQNNFNKTVVVGDTSQAIYQFAGAIDALERFEADLTAPLTKSYRFGPEIAGVANRFLAFLKDPYRVEGAGPSGEVVENLEDPDVVLSRTNGGGLALLAEFIQKGKKVAVDAEVWAEYNQLIWGIIGLRARVNNPGRTLYSMHPDLQGYNDIQEVLKAKKDGLLSGNVSAVLNVLQRLGSDDSEVLEGESDVDVLRNLLNKFQLVRDVNNSKFSQNYVPIPYDSIKRGSIHLLNDESPNAKEAPAYAWTDNDGNMYFTVVKNGWGNSGKKEIEDINAYFKSLGFKTEKAKDVDIPDVLGRVWENNSVFVVPRDANNNFNLPPDSDNLQNDTVPFFRLFNDARKFANGYFSTDEVPISFTTAHKSKGREWDKVKLARDFAEPKVNEETLELEFPDVPEINLAYTTVTRAKKVVDIGNLSWIYDETSDSDEAYVLPTPAENRLNLAIPQKKVTRPVWEESVEKADKALTDETNRVLDALNKAIADGSTPPWLAPWGGQNPSSQLPISVTTGKSYSGTNVIYLQAVAKNNGWSDSRWATQEEINRRGGKVKDGQRPTRMTAWLPNYTTVTDENGNKLETIYSVSPVDHFVYNAEQVDGLNLGNVPRSSPSTPLEAENIIFGSYTDIPKIINRPLSNQEENQNLSPAYYDEVRDILVTPNREDFDSPEKYFEALAHELIHSTGAVNRLNRETVTIPGGVEAYSVKTLDQMQVEEEFIAQIGTALLASRLGVNLDIPNVAAYMVAWKETFGSSPNRLARAARAAQDAVDYILKGRDSSTPPPASPSEPTRELVGAENRFNLAIPTEPTTPENLGNEVSETKSKTQEISEKVTAMVVQAIENGEELPWNKPWTSKNIFSLPYSVTSNKPYRGFNIISLWITALNNGWEDNRWITFNEAKKRGGSVKKGSKGTPVVHWSPVVKKVEQADGSLKDEVAFMRPSVYTVFNVEQTEGVQNLPEPELMEPVPLLDAERLVLEGYKDAPPITNKLQDKAFWQPSTDEIVMPLREQFADVNEYVATLFHELTHSTGHSSRLNRDDLGDKYSTHLDARGEEELIAELGSAILAARMGLELDLSRTAGYAQSWLRPLKNNPEMIAKAAQRAQAAVDYILGQDPYRGESGRSGEERAADLEKAAKEDAEAPKPNLGEQGVTGENND